MVPSEAVVRLRPLTQVKFPASAIEVAGGVANGVAGNCLPVKTGEQVLPVGITVGVTVSGSAIGRSQDIARTIVGIGVVRISRRFQQLALVVVGVGNGALPGSGEGCDITYAVIGITIPLPAAGHRRHLHGGLGAVNIPVGILPGDGAAGNGSQPPQAIVAHGQGSTHTGGHGIQTAVGRIVIISLGIGCIIKYTENLLQLYFFEQQSNILKTGPWKLSPMASL